MIGWFILAIITLYLLIGIGYAIYGFWLDNKSGTGFMEFEDFPFYVQIALFLVAVLLWPVWWRMSR